MIVRISASTSPRIEEAGDLKRLSVVLGPGASPDMIAPLGRADEDREHVWLDTSALRAAADPGAADPGWPGRFEAMVAYAASKGWTRADGSGLSLRAHVEPEEVGN